MKVLVCGSRDWTDPHAIRRELEKLPKGTIIVHGGARGADTIAGELAKQMDFEVRVYPANWQAYGNRAGPIRNSLMLDVEHPDKAGLSIDLCLAFAEDFSLARGTSDMCRKAKAKAIAVEPYSL